MNSGLEFSFKIFFSFKIKFQPSNHTVETGLIGQINWMKIGEIKMKSIEETIKKGVFKTISIGVQPFEIKRLPNGTFITNNSSSVTLFDESFNLLKKIDIKGHAIGCAIHNDKNIYITDYDKHCIYLMDNELNTIKTFGSKGDRMCQLFLPRTIFCENDYLFVSDRLNKRIQILTLDLKYHDTIQLDFYPKSIAVSNTRIGINGSNDKIHFYDLQTKTLKKEYRNINGRISLIDSHFYVLTYKQPQKLFIFDEEGELVDEASVESISEYIEYHYDGFMFSTKDNLFVTSNSGGNVLKFKL